MLLVDIDVVLALRRWTSSHDRSPHSIGLAMPLLDPTLDVVFKLMLLREPALLADMLQGILARPVGAPAVLDSGVLGDQVHDKQVALDLRLALADGSRVDLEMQRIIPANLTARLAYYSARDYSDQLVRGDDYGALTSTSVIAWVGKPLFPKLRRLHSIFELRDRHTHTLFSDHLAFHILQLPYLHLLLVVSHLWDPL